MIPRTLDSLLKTYHFPYRKMAFLAGPRQVGKTTLAKLLLKQRETTSLYYNWDNVRQKRLLLKDPYAFEKDIPITKERSLVVFDEIHKYPRWKNYLKGVFDQFGAELDFLVTGSGRLNIYKKGADSLVGRFFLYTLLPLSVGEISHHSLKNVNELFKEFPSPTKHLSNVFDHLLTQSGFPEPFLAADASFLNRWETTRKELILRQDVRDLTNVRELALMEHLLHLLPSRIGSPLSLNSLCLEIGVAHKTIQNWMDILERVYYLFTLRPYSKKIRQSIKKERKIYFWNWAEPDDEAKRFENFIACHLQKMVSTYNDFGLAKLRLHYCRNKLGKEVDFLLVRDEKPWILVEAKLAEKTPAPALYSFMKQLGLKEAFQIIRTPGIHFKRSSEDGVIHVISADLFLENLP